MFWSLVAVARNHQVLLLKTAKTVILFHIVCFALLCFLNQGLSVIQAGLHLAM